MSDVSFDAVKIKKKQSRLWDAVPWQVIDAVVSQAVYLISYILSKKSSRIPWGFCLVIGGLLVRVYS